MAAISKASLVRRNQIQPVLITLIALLRGHSAVAWLRCLLFVA